MNAFDLIELLMKLALLVGVVFVLSWAPLFRKWFKPYGCQFEPFEYFAYRGSMPKRWLVAENFFPTTEPGYPLAGHHLHYSDEQYEYVSVARVVALPPGSTPLTDSGGRLVGYLRP